MVNASRLEQALQSLGATRDFEPKPLNQARIVMLGYPAGGKTTLVAGNPKALILDFDKKANTIPDMQAQRVTMKDIAHMEQVIETLAGYKDVPFGERPVQTVVVDSMTSWSTTLSDHLTKKHCVTKDGNTTYQRIEDMPHGKGYELMFQAMRKATLTLENAGYGWILIGHFEGLVRRDEKSGKEYTVERPWGNRKIFSYCMGMSEMRIGVSLGMDSVKNIETGKYGPLEPTVELNFEGQGIGAGDPEAFKMGALLRFPETLHVPQKGAWSYLSAYYDWLVEQEKANAKFTA